MRGKVPTWNAFQDAGRKRSFLAELKYMNHSIIHDLKTGGGKNKIFSEHLNMSIPGKISLVISLLEDGNPSGSFSSAPSVPPWSPNHSYLAGIVTWDHPAQHPHCLIRILPLLQWSLLKTQLPQLSSNDTPASKHLSRELLIPRQI